MSCSCGHGERLEEKGDTKLLPFCEIVCYGLGNFAECFIARYQLGLLLALRGEYTVILNNISSQIFLGSQNGILGYLAFGL